MRRLTLALVTLATSLVLVGPAAATTFSTLDAWNGSQNISSWGSLSSGGTPTYGQTFTGTGETLNSFTFYLDVPSDTVFRGGVYVWDGTEATTQIWQGGNMTLPGSGMRPVTFTPGVPLGKGQVYVLLATTVYSPDIANSAGTWGFISSDGSAYPGGQFVYTNDPTSISSPWDGIDWTFSDLAFTATLSPTTCPGGSYANGDGFCVQFARAAVCAKDGSFQDIELSQMGSTDYGSTPAAYVQGYGLMCALSDVATYGGDASAYKDQGYKVDELGMRAPDGYSDAIWNALYEYFAKP